MNELMRAAEYNCFAWRHRINYSAYQAYSIIHMSYFHGNHCATVLPSEIKAASSLELLWVSLIQLYKKG